MQQAILNGFRLSPQQARLWLVQQCCSPFFAQSAVLIEGDLNPELINTAVGQVVDRYEVLRTTYHLLSGMKYPVQVISQNGAPVLRRAALEHRDSQDLASTVESLLQEERQKPFDLEQGSLLRASLADLTPGKHVLTLTLPSICADSWTLKNIVQEIWRAYASSEGDPEALEEPLQYVQFSEWQNELLADEDAETGRTFWQGQNYSASDLSLPFERNPRVGTSPAPDSFSLAVNADLVERLEAFAGKLGADLPEVLLAGWHILLWRLTGQGDIVVGDACDGRPHEILHNALGLFVKWLPIRCHFEPGYQFRDILTQVSTARENAYEWQEYFTWEEINTHSAVNGDQTPYYPFGFDFQELPLKATANGIAFSLFMQRSRTDRFNLLLSCTRSSDSSLELVFEYDPARFRTGDIQRLAGHFETLLHSILLEPEAPVSELEILGSEDRQQLLVTFNQTGSEYPNEKCLHRLFEEQVERSPDRPAVIYRDQRLSYAELNAKANQLAGYLQKLGVGPEARVGLCLERSPEMIVGFLGILKAGGAYLPLDPMHPPERLAFTLSDAQATVLITQEGLVESLPETNSHLVRLDADWETIARENEANPVSGTVPENLAYVIYTSGSTGKPKGVMVQHASVINLAFGLQKSVYDRLDAQLKVSLNAPLTFDSSVKQLVQLLFGHTLCIVPEEARPDGRELLAFVERNSLDVLDCTPAQLSLLLEAAAIREPQFRPTLVLVGGEAIHEATWKILRADNETRFFNVYGPTECTVDATVSDIQQAPDQPTIGRPIANTQIYILENRQKPAPIGVPGELCIAGAGLSRGYLERPDITAEKFVPNPFAEEPGARMYRTGDLAAYFPDGNIDFIGRIDHQVKLRGFRIELGEIEAVLEQHPAVREAAAIVRQDQPGDPRLVAYLVLKQKSAEVIAELRTFLRGKLPEYMIPSAFVILDELPLTRNGKVNRGALPLPESVQSQIPATYVAPRSKLEETIAAIWQDVLQVEKVGANDNFFDLGGHSLLMVRVHNRLREAFDKEISLIEMFRNPTVSMLAKYFSDEETREVSVDSAQERAEKRISAKERRRTQAEKRRQAS